MDDLVDEIYLPGCMVRYRLSQTGEAGPMVRTCVYENEKLLLDFYSLVDFTPTAYKFRQYMLEETRHLGFGMAVLCRDTTQAARLPCYQIHSAIETFKISPQVGTALGLYYLVLARACEGQSLFQWYASVGNGQSNRG